MICQLRCHELTSLWIVARSNMNWFAEPKGCSMNFVDMQSTIARYFCFHKIDMFFALLKTRYDINLVALATYRVHKHISSHLWHIENLDRDLYRRKKDIFHYRKMSFFLMRAVGLEPTRHKHTPLKRACLPIPACSLIASTKRIISL